MMQVTATYIRPRLSQLNDAIIRGCAKIDSIKEMSRFTSVTMLPIDPVELLPMASGALPINCNRHQAPHGYMYKLINGVCVLVRRDTGAVVISQAGTGAVYSTYLPSATATVSNFTNGITTWLRNNKTLALALAAGGYYLLTRKK